VLPYDIGLSWGDTKILLLAICISDENPDEAVNQALDKVGIHGNLIIDSLTTSSAGVLVEVGGSGNGPTSRRLLSNIRTNRKTPTYKRLIA
jgi:hypothetical protein